MPTSLSAPYQIGLMQELARAAMLRIGSAIPNTRLRQHCRIVGPVGSQFARNDPEGGADGFRLATGGWVFGGLFIRDFWAIAAHNGSRSFGPGAYGSRVLAWFRDPMDDPRKDRGYQVKLGKDYRRMTRQEWQAAQAENARLYKANPSGGIMQHMVWTRRRVAPVAGTFFFTQGVAVETFRAEALLLAHDYTMRFTLQHLPRGLRDGVIVKGLMVHLRV